MKLKDHLPLATNELIIALVVLGVVSVFTFASRQYRLHSESAISFIEPIDLYFYDKSSLPDLVLELDSIQHDYNREELEWAARILGWRTYRKGKYTLEGNYSYDEFLGNFAKGIQDPATLVILPGISESRFISSVATQLAVTKNEIDRVMNDSLILAGLNTDKQQLIGQLLPETYLLYWTTPAEDILKRVVNEFDDKVIDIYTGSEISKDLTLEEVVTLASIVEWEAKDEDEKARIAGLYYNRLKRRMYLQADPTVNFALGERRRLLYEDYEFEHPYNTYKNFGLPPGPITNPALSTIRATINYEHHNFLYMVASPDGGHVFSRTFEQHKIASEKWRRWLQKQYRIKRQQEAEKEAG